MTNLNRNALIGLVMFMAAGLAFALKPTQQLASPGPKVDLEAMIPKQFGDWHIDETLVPLQVSPDVQAQLNVLYAQTLSRTYINGNGYRVMLSIAYGSNQLSDDFQVHRPEYCYRAQGFQVNASEDQFIDLGKRALKVRRLEATQADRHEPVTYWITIGDKATLPGIWRKMTQLRYGLTGRIPDGLLFRVSSIDPATETAYRTQDQFVRELLSHLDHAQQIKLIGDS